jgi:hypothetical protein
MFLAKDPAVAAAAVAFAVAITLSIWAFQALSRGGVVELRTRMRTLLPLLGIAILLVAIVIAIAVASRDIR